MATLVMTKAGKMCRKLDPVTKRKEGVSSPSHPARSSCPNPFTGLTELRGAGREGRGP